MSNIRDFAIRAHGDQKYGNQPYVVHLDEVVGILHEYGHMLPEVEAAGYLHDVLEDTDTEYETLEAAFGYVTARAVLFCTDEPGPNRKTRKALTYERCRQQILSNNPLVPNQVVDMPNPMPIIVGVVVKVADRLANLRATKRDGNDGLFKMYAKERQAFREALYVGGLCDSMWAEYDRLLGG